MKLNSRSLVPPGLFRYRHPVSGLEMSRHAWSLLRSDVDQHTQSNGYPAVTDEEIEAQMCERMGEKVADQYCDGRGLSVNGITLHWKELMAGTAVLLSHLLGGRKVVSQEEAERRAAICAPCPRNSTFSKPCGGLCPELEDVVKAVVGGGKTSLDDKLEACSVCGCVNRAQIWTPIDALAAGSGPDFIEKAPEPCWKRKALIELAGKSA